MSVFIFKMLKCNEPLSKWREFDDTRFPSGFADKNTDKVAAMIFRQLSHDSAVDLVAREFVNLPADLRLRLRTLCNDANATGNVRKGVQKLNKLMNGNLLREEVHVERFQTQTRDGWKAQKVNAAIAGATRKYGIVR